MIKRTSIYRTDSYTVTSIWYFILMRPTKLYRTVKTRPRRYEWYITLIILVFRTSRRSCNTLRTCLDTLTFDLILVKLDQKQEFLIHEKLCTPL
ncbi:hypothetical protein Lp16_F023 (plasmid) [Lactiplantibacillus plantarum 16]|nr:hypothetical protein Lp16_F023 [Lactiplantibacillus plantarum 16]